MFIKKEYKKPNCRNLQRRQSKQTGWSSAAHSCYYNYNYRVAPPAWAPGRQLQVCSVSGQRSPVVSYICFLQRWRDDSRSTTSRRGNWRSERVFVQRAEGRRSFFKSPQEEKKNNNHVHRRGFLVLLTSYWTARDQWSTLIGQKRTVRTQRPPLLENYRWELTRGDVSVIWVSDQNIKINLRMFTWLLHQKIKENQKWNQNETKTRLKHVKHKYIITILCIYYNQPHLELWVRK